MVLKLTIMMNVFKISLREDAIEMNENEEEGSSSKGSSDSEDDLDSPCQIHQVPESPRCKTERTVEDMDVTPDGLLMFSRSY